MNLKQNVVHQTIYRYQRRKERKLVTAQQYLKLHGLPNVASFETNLKINNQQ